MEPTGRRNRSGAGCVGASGATAYMDSFVGREEELEELERRLDAGVRVATIVGPPGVGKTRLLHEFIARGGRAFRLVSLAGCETRLDSLRKFGQALGVELEEASPASAIRRFSRVLAAEQLPILAVDNAEHVIDEVAELIAALIRETDTQFLVTSRESLQINSEQIVRLGPLGVGRQAGDSSERSESMRLFVDRAQKQLPGLEIDSDREGVVEELLVRMDGLPLAIELAAAHLGSMSPETLLERTRNGEARLESQLRGVPERHRSLHKAVAWSWDLLLECERELLMCLSAIRGSFHLEFVESWVDEAWLGGRPIHTTLQSLVDKSLVLPRSSASRSEGLSLLQSVRDFAHDRLVEGSHFDQVYTALATCLSELASPPKGRRQAGFANEVASLIDREDGLRAGLSYALTAGKAELAFSVFRCLYAAHHKKEWVAFESDLLDHLIALLRSSDGLDPHCLTEALVVQLEVRSAQGLPSLDTKAVAEIRERLERMPSAALELRLACNLAANLAAIGRFVEARQLLEACDPELVPASLRTLHMLSLARALRSEPTQVDRTRSLLAAVATNPEVDGAVWMRAAAARWLGRELHMDGAVGEAISWSNRAVELSEEVGACDDIALARAFRAMICIDLERYSDAVANLDAAIQVSQKGGLDCTSAYVRLAICFNAMGESQQALEAVDACEAPSESTPVFVAYQAPLNRALAHWGLGDKRTARAFFERAVEAPASVTAPMATLLWSALAVARKSAGVLPGAEEALDKSRAAEASAPERAIRLAAQCFRVLAQGPTVEHLESLVAIQSTLWSDRPHMPSSYWLRIALRLLVEDHADLSARLFDGVMSARQDGLLIQRSTHRIHISDRDFDTLSGKSWATLVPLLSHRLGGYLTSKSPEELIEAIWPGESMSYDSAMNRLHFNLSQLRKMGLKGVLLSDGEGYYLDPEVPILVVG